MARGAEDTTEYGNLNPNGDEEAVKTTSAQVIEPEQFHNEEIYRVYVSANPGISKFRDAFRSAILDEGDLIIECCDRKIDLAKIMGRIDISDAVIIAVDRKSVV